MESRRTRGCTTESGALHSQVGLWGARNSCKDWRAIPEERFVPGGEEDGRKQARRVLIKWEKSSLSPFL